MDFNSSYIEVSWQNQCDYKGTTYLFCCEKEAHLLSFLTYVSDILKNNVGNSILVDENDLKVEKSHLRKS